LKSDTPSLSNLDILDAITCSLETGSQYVAQVDLEFEILLHQVPECRDYKHAPAILAFTAFSRSN
jgi:hypothetical protein